MRYVLHMAYESIKLTPEAAQAVRSMAAKLSIQFGRRITQSETVLGLVTLAGKNFPTLIDSKESTDESGI